MGGRPRANRKPNAVNRLQSVPEKRGASVARRLVAGEHAHAAGPTMPPGTATSCSRHETMGPSWRVAPVWARLSAPMKPYRSPYTEDLNRRVRAVLSHAVAAHKDENKVYESLRNLNEVIGTEYGDRVLYELAQAFAEFGRIDKTIHTLTYLDDEAKRRATLIQLNRGEGRHALARAVFHGKRGELRQRYREGQENQLDALGVVVNMIVLWNTIYMQAALDLHRADGHSVRPEDEARLSPLGHEHINLLERYSFAVPESVARGELRPLRNPADGGR